MKDLIYFTSIAKDINIKTEIKITVNTDDSPKFKLGDDYKFNGIGFSLVSYHSCGDTTELIFESYGEVQ